MTLSEFYAAVGGNYADAAARLRKDRLIASFLRRLPQEPSSALLGDALRAGDAKTAFRAAHTLKGIALNLSLDALAAACGGLTEALRGQDTLPPEAKALYHGVQAEYERVLVALALLETPPAD
mgnify:CR=1 FL=1